MNPRIGNLRIARFGVGYPALFGAFMVGALAAGLSGCGKQGALEQPAPLFGERAKQNYEAEKAAGVRINDERTPPKVPAADQADPNADNAPVTKRDLQAPEQKNVPLRQEPIPGEPDLVGPPPSMNPPGR